MSKRGEYNLKRKMIFWLKQRKTAKPADMINAFKADCGSQEQAAEYIRQLVQDGKIMCLKPELIK